MAIRTRSKYVYVSDDGNSYSVTLADDIGALAGYGWVAATNQPPKPSWILMRYAVLHDPATTRMVKRPIATTASAKWTTPLAAATSIDQWNDAANVDMTISSLHGEKRLLGVSALPV